MGMSPLATHPHTSKFGFHIAILQEYVLNIINPSQTDIHFICFLSLKSCNLKYLRVDLICLPSIFVKNPWIGEMMDDCGCFSDGRRQIFVGLIASSNLCNLLGTAQAISQEAN